MGSVGAMQRRLKKPDPNYKSGKSPLAFTGTMEKDPVKELTDARKTFVRRTGGKLRDVRTAGLYKSMTEEEKKRYQNLNPDEFPLGFKLGKKSILGE